MAKARLQFELPEEEAEFQAAAHGMDYKLALWNLDQSLRSRIKHSQLDSEAKEMLQAVRDELHYEIRERNLSLD